MTIPDTDINPVVAGESREDEANIVADRDQTDLKNSHSQDQYLNGARKVTRSAEEEPADFSRGEVDVKAQMDRAVLAMDRAAHGQRDNEDGPDSAETELEIADRKNH